LRNWFVLWLISSFETLTGDVCPMGLVGKIAAECPLMGLGNT